MARAGFKLAGIFLILSVFGFFLAITKMQKEISEEILETGGTTRQVFRDFLEAVEMPLDKSTEEYKERCSEVCLELSKRAIPMNLQQHLQELSRAYERHDPNEPDRLKSIKNDRYFLHCLNEVWSDFYKILGKDRCSRILTELKEK